MSTMAAEKTINPDGLALKYNIGANYFRTILCRSEFSKLQRPKLVGKARTFLNYLDCPELHQKIKRVMMLKKTRHVGRLT